MTAQLNLGLCARLFIISLFRSVKNNILKSIEIKQGNNFSEMTTETVKIFLIFLMFKKKKN